MKKIRCAADISPVFCDNWTDYVPTYYSYYDSYVRMKKEKKKTMRQRMLFAAAIVIAIVIFMAADTFGKTSGEPLAEHCVEAGDTLWSIALEYKPEGRRVDEFVYDIKKLNDLKSSVIIAGEILTIPN